MRQKKGKCPGKVCFSLLPCQCWAVSGEKRLKSCSREDLFCAVPLRQYVCPHMKGSVDLTQPGLKRNEVPGLPPSQHSSSNSWALVRPKQPCTNLPLVFSLSSWAEAAVRLPMLQRKNRTLPKSSLPLAAAPGAELACAHLLFDALPCP